MVTIDSLKIRIPIYQVDVVNKELSDLYGVFRLDESGELIVTPDEFKKRAMTIKVDGITTRYSIATIPTAHGQHQECLLIMLNSKLLKYNYFHGIRKSNIATIWNAIIDQKVIFVNYSYFMNAALTDVDIKKDFRSLNRESQERMIKVYADISKPSPLKDKGYLKFATKTNLGIQWSDRKHGTIGNPFVKIYAKDIELVHDSYAFYKKFIPVLEPMMRIEGTIKNFAHWKALFETDDRFSFDNLFDISEDRLDQALASMVMRHLDITAEPHHKERLERLGLSDVFALSLLTRCQSLELAKIYALPFTDDNPDQRYRVNQKLDYLWRERMTHEEQSIASDLDGSLSFVMQSKKITNQISLFNEKIDL